MKYLAEQAATSSFPMPKGHQIVQSAEDPIVTSVLGPATPSSTKTDETAAMHYGFSCDSSGATPIVGVRYKATNKTDLDITEACRRQGRFPPCGGGAGWQAIPDASSALRAALAAVLDWWQLLWPTRSDLFGPTPPDLTRLPLAGLVQAVQQLPVEEQRFRKLVPASLGHGGS